MAGTKSLSVRQKSFIEYLLQGCSGTEAVKKAGYKSKNANDQYLSLMGQDLVRRELDRRKTELEEKTELNAESLKRMAMDIAVRGRSDSVRLQAIDMLNRILGVYEADNQQRATIMPTQINIITNGPRNQ